MTATFARVLDHTATNCRLNCGLMTVLIDRYGTGQMTRVHCGTYREKCPQEPRPVPQWRG
ncbi:hypothetical protein FKR81_14770 [Lentzea tibetensis]|uniref:Uncharacterized protein n=1 Tax=Lentzea tibetensis TaxID=2591470 RepID=A0A563EUZ6_9PSEU|nr:hypothetical protein [Lentzea tibetensis]TWP51473.1 hypothetical protein FKR81_14770 [Lentzea tibetensis]